MRKIYNSNNEEFDKEIIMQIVNDINNNYTIDDISMAYDLPKSKVRYINRTYNPNYKPYRHMTKSGIAMENKIPNIIEMLYSGYTLPYISDQLDISVQAVENIKKKIY